MIPDAGFPRPVELSKGEDDDVYVEADARLIAAAPEMLEFVHTLLDLCESKQIPLNKEYLAESARAAHAPA